MESIAQSAMVPASLKGKESVMDNGVSFLPAASRARWIKHAMLQPMKRMPEHLIQCLIWQDKGTELEGRRKVLVMRPARKLQA